MKLFLPYLFILACTPIPKPTLPQQEPPFVVQGFEEEEDYVTDQLSATADKDCPLYKQIKGKSVSVLGRGSKLVVEEEVPGWFSTKMSGKTYFLKADCLKVVHEVYAP